MARRPEFRFWRWGRPERARTRTARRQRLIFEGLEPRLLLSSTPLPEVLPFDPIVAIDSHALVQGLEPPARPMVPEMLAQASPIALEPVAGGQVLLTVTGTSGADVIVVKGGRAPGQVEVTVNGAPKSVIEHVAGILILAGDGSDRIDVAERVLIGAEIHAGGGDDHLKGGAGADLIFGEGGDDLIEGRAGEDEIDGGPGDDALKGGSGNDVIRGGGGRDRIEGGNGHDRIEAGPGNDTVKAQAGDDEAAGGPGRDLIEGGEGNDFLDGGEDVDIIKGQSGVDTAINGEILNGVESAAETIAPVITAELARDTGTSAGDGVTSDPAISGDLNDASPIAVFRAGLDAMAPADFADVLDLLEADGQFSFDRARLEAIARSALADGPHTLRLAAQDAFGNASPIFDLTFVLDTQAPLSPTGLALAVGSDSGDNATDGITSDATPTVGGDAESGAVVRLFRDGVLAGQTTADSPWQVTLGALADDVYEFTATAEDLAGNLSDASASLSVTIDTVAPAVPAFDLAVGSDTAPAGDQQTTMASVRLEGVTEPMAGVALVGAGLTSTADDAGDFGFDGIALALGPNAFTTVATDVAGNASEFSLTITRVPEGEDHEPPLVTAALSNDTGASAADAITSDPGIAGQVTDLDPLLAVLIGLDGMALEDFGDVLGDLAADGTFALTRARLEQIAGAPLGDGAHTVHIQAQDAALNTSAIVDVAFVLDTTPPALLVDEPADGATVAPGAELSGTVHDPGSAVASVLYTLGGLPPIAIAVGPTGAFGQPLALAAVGSGAQSLAVEATDAAGNIASAALDLIVDTPFTLSAHAPLHGMEDVGVRARPQINFSKAVDAATVNAASFFASAGGETLPATIVVSNGGRHAWLYATGGLPGGAEVEITVDGSLIHALDGETLDADGDGAPGGIARFAFTTGSVVALSGTTLSGRVLDVGPDFLPLTADDVEAGPDGQVGTEDDVFLRPVANAPVFLLGLEDDVVFTDATGRFHFDAVPAGDVKVVIDGQEVAASGTNFPEVILDVRMDPATENDLGAIYLPRLGADAYASVNAAQETVLTLTPGSAFGLTEEQRQQFTLTVAPDSLLSADGQRMAAGEVGLGVVPLDMLESLLPTGLPDPALAFTIQTRGFTDFAEPAWLTLPNLTGAAPGTEFLLLTFDHTTKHLIDEGTVVVSSAPGAPLVAMLNGAAASLSLSDLLSSLPGVGIAFACFHLVVPNGSPTGPPCPPGSDHPVDVEPVVEFSGLDDRLFIRDDGTFQMMFSNFAEPIEPAADECADVNRQATPLVIQIEVDGPAGAFLQGLQSETIELLPREIALIDVDVKDFAGQLRSLTTDQLYAAHVHVTGFKSTTPDVLLIDEEFSIARFVSVGDPQGTGAVFLKTFADGPGGFAREKLVEHHLPTDVLTEITGAAPFALGVQGPLLGEGTTTWFFDPTGGGPITTNASVVVDGQALPQTIRVSGTRVEPTTVGVDRAAYEAAFREYLDDPVHWSGPPSPTEAGPTFKNLFGQFVPSLLGRPLTPAEILNRDSLIAQSFDALLAAMRADYDPVNGGEQVVAIGDGGGAVALQWAPVVITPEGDNVLGAANDDSIDSALEPIWKNEALSDAAKEWALAEFLNVSPTNAGIMSIGRHANGWAGDTSFAIYVANTVSHESAHTFGLLDAYLNFPGGGTVNMPPNDLMRGGDDHDPDLSFADVNVDTLRAALGLAPDAPGSLASALAMYRKNFHLPKNTVGVRENVDFASEVPHLGVAVGANDLFDGEKLAAGLVLADGPGSTAFTASLALTNTGLAPLTIGSVALGGGATGFALAGPPPAGTVLAAGETAMVEVRFDPAVAGLATDILTITSDAPTSSPFTLALTGDGLTTSGRIATALARDPFTGAGTQNNLGGLVLGAAPRTVQDLLTIRNDGGGDLTITALTVTGESASQFAVSGLPPGFGPGNPLVLAPGEAFALDVTFDAAAPGLQRAQLEIASDDPATPVLRQTVVGTGLADQGSALVYGHDYVAVELPRLPGNPVVRTVSDAGGNWTFYLAAGQSFHHAIFDADSGLIAHGFGVTAPSGIETDILTPVFQASTRPDGDGDGLPDDVEFAVGTSGSSTDTDGDGVDDFAELRAGLNPLDGRAVATGVVGGLALPGSAMDVAIEGDLAYVATGTHGLAIADVSQPPRPVLLGSVDLLGFNTDVAVDASRRLAAVAAGDEGLHIVALADEVRPTRLRTVELAGAASHVEVLDGVAYVATGSGVAAVELATGEILETLDLAGADLTGLAREGRTLYTMDAAGTLRIVDASGATMLARGTLGVPQTGGRLFVADGIAYATARQSLDGGFATLDVSDLDAPALISGPDVTGEAPDRAMAVNAGRVALLIGPSGGFDAVDVMDVTDPADTDVFRTRFLLTEAPQGVALASGVGFVADGDAGLRVLGYQATDVAGQAPTISIEAVVRDVDPLTEGIQVIEGQSILIVADTADDVDVRQVELLVNGAAAGRDVSFPHEVLLHSGAAGTAMAIQARATDAGGNVGLSGVVELHVVADTFAPEIVAIDPADGATLPEGLQRVRVRFSEGLDAATVTTDTFQVVDGGGQSVVPLSIALLGEDRLVELRYAGLTAGDYEIVIDGQAVTDRAGNAVADQDVVSAFTLTGDSIEWINPGGGFWDDPANWEGGVLPGPDDNVLIDVPGDVLITHRTGDTRINRLISRESIDLTGGTLDVTTTVLVDGTFNLSDGATLAHATVLPGAGFTPGVGGFVTFDGVTLATEVRVVELGTMFVRNGLELDRGRVTLNGAGVGATIHFAETQTLSGNGDIVFAGATDQNFVEMENLTIGPDVRIHGAQGGRVGGGFTNETMILQGTIAALTSGETVEIQVASWTNDGLVLADNGGQLELGGTFTLTDGGAIAGPNGTVSLVGTLDLAGGSLDVDGATGSLTLADSAARIKNGRITVSGGVKLAVTQGTFDAITLASDLTLPGGAALTVRNGLTLDGAVITLLDDVPFTDPALAFSGTQSLAGTGEIVFGGAFDGGRVSASSFSTLTIGPGIVIHGTQGGTVGILGAVVNQGTIIADVSGQEIDVTGSSVVNEGTLRAVNGAFMLTQAFTNAGSVEVGAAGSTFRVLAGDLVQTSGSTTMAGGTIRANTVDIQGGSLAGFGTIVGNVRNAGALTLGDAADSTRTLTVQGGYQQTASGALNVDLGGTAVANYDRLALTTAAGVATLAGTLNVALVGGFTPAPGNTFDVLTFTSRAGTFDAITGLDLGGGLALQPAFTPAAAPTRLQLTAVSV